MLTKSRLLLGNCGRFGEPWLADMESTSKIIMIDVKILFYIWTTFGHLTSGDKGSGPYMREDHSKLETCSLEERASPHVVT